MKQPNYKEAEKKRFNAALMRELLGDSGGGNYNAVARAFVLKESANNLFKDIREEVPEYFRENKITWWGGKLTGHILSSQVACLNHLFPIRKDKQAVLAVAKKIAPEIKDVLEITTDRHAPAYIQFEAVSHCPHLNEGEPTRGSNCTSLDALIYAELNDGKKIILPIEWKYTEAYGNQDKSKEIKRGEKRVRRYHELIRESKQLQRDAKLFYYEPFYQLMRQTLWAERMVWEKTREKIQADDFIHVHVIPEGNRNLLEKKYPCSDGKQMEAAWRSAIIFQEKYRIISPAGLLEPVRNMGTYTELLVVSHFQNPHKLSTDIMASIVKFFS